MRPLVLILILSAVEGLAVPGSAAPKEVAVSSATQNPFERGATAVQEGVKAFGNGAVVLSKSLRRFAVELGTGEDADLRDVTDPFMPKGLDRYFAWDVGLVIRNSGVGLKARLLDPPYFKKLSASYRLYFDPFDRAGLGDQRDNIYDGFGLKVPVEKKGYGVGFAAVRDVHWGYSLDYDRKRFSEALVLTQDQATRFEVGYTPLGENNGHKWNWTWLTSVDWQDIETTSSTVHTDKHGPGFAFGPVYQYGLEGIRVPFTGELNSGRGVRLNRFKTGLSYNDSQIHSSRFDLRLDLSMYLTKAARLTLGAVESYFPASGRWQTRPQVSLSVILNFRNFKL